jgi:hypothetical protein
MASKLRNASIRKENGSPLFAVGRSFSIEKKDTNFFQASSLQKLNESSFALIHFALPLRSARCAAVSGRAFLLVEWFLSLFSPLYLLLHNRMKDCVTRKEI